MSEFEKVLNVIGTLYDDVDRVNIDVYPINHDRGAECLVSVDTDEVAGFGTLNVHNKSVFIECGGGDTYQEEVTPTEAIRKITVYIDNYLKEHPVRKITRMG